MRSRDILARGLLRVTRGDFSRITRLRLGGKPLTLHCPPRGRWGGGPWLPPHESTSPCLHSSGGTAAGAVACGEMPRSLTALRRRNRPYLEPPASSLLQHPGVADSRGPEAAGGHARPADPPGKGTSGVGAWRLGDGGAVGFGPSERGASGLVCVPTQHWPRGRALEGGRGWNTCLKPALDPGIASPVGLL